MITKSNRHLHDHFSKKGNEFTYSILLSYLAQNVKDDHENSVNVPVPLFAPNMFETFYNEITNNMANTIKPPLASGNVGIGAYGGNIWNALAQFDLGALNHTTFYPYGAQNIVNPFFTNEFFMKIAQGDLMGNVENTLSGWVKFSSMKMAYLNFMRTLQTKKVHCSNINFQWSEDASQPSQMRQNPLLFFEQKIDGTIFTNEVTIGQYFKPDNLSSRTGISTFGSQVKRFNIDVPCDWIFSASSGISIGWDCYNFYANDQDEYGILNVNFTLHEIK